MYFTDPGKALKKKHVNSILRKDNFGWNELLASGVLEYIDVEEEETTMIAMTLRDIKGNECCYM
jgi:DNA-directed RNA polymerase II subunit RPB2